MTLAPPRPAAPARPRLVLMGEFSSGKSTLANLLLGGPVLPTQVTATRLPPVFVSHGAASAQALGHGGETQSVDLSQRGSFAPGRFRALRLTLESALLQLCDLADLPGISDPNLPEGSWDGILGAADIVLWCTHATQAWRQSEAAMWERLRGATAGRNLLLVTQIDKLQGPGARDRVLARVAAETEGRFAAIYPVALLQALAAGSDEDQWRESGVQRLIEDLIEMLIPAEGAAPEPPPAGAAAPAAPATGPADPARGPVRPQRVERRRDAPAPAGQAEPA